MENTMKNVMMIDIDSERENQIIFSKPEEFVMPTTDEEYKTMIVLDLKTLTHALGSLVKITETSEIGSGILLVEEITSILNEYVKKGPEDEIGEIIVADEIIVNDDKTINPESNGDVL